MYLDYLTALGEPGSIPELVVIPVRDIYFRKVCVSVVTSYIFLLIEQLALWFKLSSKELYIVLVDRAVGSMI